MGVFICHRVNLLIGIKGTRDRAALSALTLHGDWTTNVTGTPRRMLPCPYENRLCVCVCVWNSVLPNSRVTLTRGSSNRAPAVCIMQPAATLVNSVPTQKNSTIMSAVRYSAYRYFSTCSSRPSPR